MYNEFKAKHGDKTFFRSAYQEPMRLNVKVYAKDRQGEGKDSVVLVWPERRRGQAGYIIRQIG